MTNFKLTPPDVQSRPNDLQWQQQKWEALLWRLLCCAVFFVIIWADRITIQVDTNALVPASLNTQMEPLKRHFFGLITAQERSVYHCPEVIPDAHWVIVGDPGYAARFGIGEQDRLNSVTACQQFVQRFYAVAVAEMRHFQIPASVLLAQAILESNAGTADFVESTHNFFPGTCSDPHCEAKHDANDLEAVAAEIHAYDHWWSSFRAHCKFLTRQLTTEGRTSPFANTEAWTRWVAAVYAPMDETYAEKLDAIIARLELKDFDRRR